MNEDIGFPYWVEYDRHMVRIGILTEEEVVGRFESGSIGDAAFSLISGRRSGLDRWAHRLRGIGDAILELSVATEVNDDGQIDLLVSDADGTEYSTRVNSDIARKILVEIARSKTIPKSYGWSIID